MAISLSSIRKGVRVMPPRIVLHGGKGLGKTTFAAGAPKPIFAPTEDGLGTLNVESFPLARSYADFMGGLSALANESHEFQTVVVDSLDWLEPLIWQEACSRHSQPNIEAFGFGKGYLAASEIWREVFDTLTHLRDAKGMASILICHTHVKRFEAPDVDPYDRYQLKLHERASAITQEWADAILFAQMKTFTKTVKGDFGKETTRGISTGERVMFTEERPAYVAKNRYQLPHELPLRWDAFADAMSASIARNEQAAAA